MGVVSSELGWGTNREGRHGWCEDLKGNSGEEVDGAWKTNRKRGRKEATG